MRRIAIVVASGFEEAELAGLREALSGSGIVAELVAAKKHEVRGWRNTEWGGSVAVDRALVDARAEDYGAVIIPGGLIAANTLRADAHAVTLVRDALAQGKPVAALGHAPWILIEAEAVAGRAVTSILAIRRDLENAGGRWLDEAVVADRGLITGRNHHDLPDFTAGILEVLR